MTTTPQAFPLHEYWLEHKRALALELASQRENMLAEIRNTERSTLLGLDLVIDKVAVMESELRREGRRIVDELTKREHAVWKRIGAREAALHKMQQSLDAQLMAVVTRSKELELEESSAAVRVSSRRQEVETWAEELEAKFLTREAELRMLTRNVEADLGVLFATRKHDAIEASPTRHLHHFASITFADKDLPRVIIGTPTHLRFEVSPCGPLVGMPATMTYLEGKKGSIGGTFVTAVQPDGGISFNDIIFNGPPGTSHVVLVSVPRVAAGTVQALELPIHLKASPTVRAIGAWNVSQLSLTGRLKVMGVELFGLLAQSMPIVVTHIPSGFSQEFTSTANELNEFSFEFKLPTSGPHALHWDDVTRGKVYIEAHVPASKYTTPFFHKFQVVCHSSQYPSFQYPPLDRGRDRGLSLTSIDLPYSELVTDIALCDSGTLLATADVAGTVSVYHYSDNKWSIKHKLAHLTFISAVQWSTGGSHIALLEPKRGRLVMWSLTDLLLRGEELPATAEPTASFIVQHLGVTHIAPLADTPTASLVGCNGGVMLFTAGRDVVEMAERQGTTLTRLAHVHVKKFGGVCLSGYQDGTVIVTSVSGRRELYRTCVSTHDAVVDFAMLDAGRIAVCSQSSVTVMTSASTWATMHCAFRSPSPLVGVMLVQLSTELALADTLVMLLHEDGNVCLATLEDARVCAYTTLRDVNGLSTMRGISLRENTLVIAACAALRPLSFEVRVTARDELEAPTDLTETSLDVQFRRRVAHRSPSSAGGATPRGTTPRGGGASFSNRSTPRSARPATPGR